MAAADTGRHGRRMLACWLACLVLAGTCGCGSKPKKKVKPAAGTAAEKLPTVDLETALAVDEGRIAVASPTGWTRLPRTQDCLVKYQPGPKKTYPRILVTADAAPTDFATVTADNHEAFVAAIATGVSETLGKAKPLKKATPVKVGPHLGAFWGVPGAAKVDGISEPIERWSYAVVIGGRLYTVEARAPKGKLDDDARAAAKAVAAALAPPAEEASPPEDAPPAEDAAPADATPPAEAAAAKPAA